MVIRSANTTVDLVASSADDETVFKRCVIAMKDPYDDRYSDREARLADQYVREVFRRGYREEFLQLPDSFKQYMANQFSSVYSIELGFSLLRLKSGVLPIRMEMEKDCSLEQLKNSMYRDFGEHFNNLGSEDFLNRLYSYFITHGNKKEKELRWTLLYLGRADPYMAYTALVLKEVYGEQKVMSFLDRLTSEMPVRDFSDYRPDNVKNDPLNITALDAINIVQSDLDFSETSIYWAVKIFRQDA